MTWFRLSLGPPADLLVTSLALLLLLALAARRALTARRAE